MISPSSLAASRQKNASRYPGESRTKMRARLFVYGHGLAGSREGLKVGFVGTEPDNESDLDLNYILWPRERILMVDSDSAPNVLAAIKKVRSMGIRAERGRLEKILERERPRIGFANLDFMGFGRAAQATALATARLIVPNGTLAMSWLRGREQTGHQDWHVWQVLGRRNRLEGVKKLVRSWNLGFEFLGSIDYHHRCSPMTAAVWRRIR